MQEQNQRWNFVRVTFYATKTKALYPTPCVTWSWRFRNWRKGCSVLHIYKFIYFRDKYFFSGYNLKRPLCCLLVYIFCNQDNIFFFRLLVSAVACGANFSSFSAFSNSYILNTHENVAFIYLKPLLNSSPYAKERRIKKKYIYIKYKK